MRPLSPLRGGALPMSAATRAERTRRRRGKRRRRRAFGTVERLPSGRFRARVVGPGRAVRVGAGDVRDGTDAAVWVDLQHADLVRAYGRPPTAGGSSRRRWGSTSRGGSPSTRRHGASTKELYVGTAPHLHRRRPWGRVPVGSLTAGAGPALAPPARGASRRGRRRSPRGAAGSGAARSARRSVSDGRTRQAQAYRLLRAAMATAVGDGLIEAQPCRIAWRGDSSPGGGPGPGRRGAVAVPGAGRTRWRTRCRRGTGCWC